jgi:hypothetical protein
MVKTIIELTYESGDGVEVNIRGSEEGSNYEEAKQFLTAVEHNMNEGVASTLFRVDDEAPDDLVKKVVDSDSTHKDHGVEDGVRRGLEIQPGTPTDQEVENLRQRIKDKVGTDVLAKKPKHTPADHVYNDLPDDHVGDKAPSWAGPEGEQGAGGPESSVSGEGNGPPDKQFDEIIKNDMPSIGEGKWVCTHPDHGSPEKNDIGAECSKGHQGEPSNNYASIHRKPFDPSGFM